MLVCIADGVWKQKTVDMLEVGLSERRPGPFDGQS